MSRFMRGDSVQIMAGQPGALRPLRASRRSVVTTVFMLIPVLSPFSGWYGAEGWS